MSSHSLTPLSRVGRCFAIERTLVARSARAARGIVLTLSLVLVTLRSTGFDSQYPQLTPEPPRVSGVAPEPTNGSRIVLAMGRKLASTHLTKSGP